MSHRFKKPPVMKPSAPPPGSLHSAHLSMEKLNRVLGKLLRDKDPEDLNAFLAQVRQSGELDRLMNAQPDDPREKALDLAAQAMGATSARQALRLADEALALDPDCVDALLVRARNRKLDAPAFIECLRQAVAAGERTLGEEFFRENRGRFWRLVETRPYMRARLELAMALGNAGLKAEAAREMERILELNPNDNQGVRDLLLSLYLALSDLKGADRLFREYRDEGGTVFAWGKLFRHLIAGDRKRAMPALAAAVETNRYFIQYLFGVLELPKESPAGYTLGSPEEAEDAMLSLLPALIAHDGFQSQIMDILPNDPASKRKSAGR